MWTLEALEPLTHGSSSRSKVADERTRDTAAILIETLETWAAATNDCGIEAFSLHMPRRCSRGNL
jgi:hypothetical protein